MYHVLAAHRAQNYTCTFCATLPCLTRTWMKLVLTACRHALGIPVDALRLRLIPSLSGVAGFSPTLW